MKYWLLADTHYGHAMLVRNNYRPEGFEAQIAKHWAASVAPDDMLVHLGDVCIGKPDDLHAQYVKSMPGRKVLVRGNHDPKGFGWYMRNGWDFCCDSFEIDYAGKRVRFTHRPEADTVADLNIHGHLHAIPEKSHRRAESLSFYGAKHVLIAMELTKYRPVLLDTVIAAHDKKRRSILKAMVDSEHAAGVYDIVPDDDMSGQRW